MNIKDTCLPDCMMPDGADPCKGYAELLEAARQLQAENAALKARVGDALEDIELLDNLVTRKT